MESARERYEKLVGLAEASYAVLRGLLQELPIPIGIPEFDTSLEVKVEALAKAREVLEQEPMNNDRRFFYQQSILDMLATFDQAAMARNFGAPDWRLDILEATIVRIGLSFKRMIDGEA